MYHNIMHSQSSDGMMSLWKAQLQVRLNKYAFDNYLTQHFIKYAGITEKHGDQKIRVLYDGHKSYAQLTFTDCAKKQNVIFFVLRPHSSHLTQPLDVGVFSTFKCMYNHEVRHIKRKPQESQLKSTQ